MSGWRVLTTIAAGFWGALVFLKLVADAIELAAEDLRVLEQSERRAKRRRLEAASEAPTEAVA
jgi:hypothetical protein